MYQQVSLIRLWSEQWFNIHNGQRASGHKPSADRLAVVQIDSQVFSRHEGNKTAFVQNIQKHVIYKQYETRREKQCGLMTIQGKFIAQYGRP